MRSTEPSNSSCSPPPAEESAGSADHGDDASPRPQWFSRRALLLHVEVAIVAPGCLIAGWWQATRALAGNGLSWFYSVEWPIFAVLSVVGWWYLIHEDPEDFRQRRWTHRHEKAAGAEKVSGASLVAVLPPVQTTTARLANALAVFVAGELVLGIIVLLVVPYDRSSGFVPAKAGGLYVAHVTLGLVLGAGATWLFVRTHKQPRIARLAGLVGGVGVLLASIGGLLTAVQALRFAGIAVMLLGTATAGIGYLFPTLEKHDN